MPVRPSSFRSRLRLIGTRLRLEANDHDRLPILFLAFIVLLFFLPSLLSPEGLIWPHSGLGSDISYRHWPDLIRYARAWASGRIVIWDSQVALGRPLAGDPTVLFLYPPAILFAWLPPALAFNALDAMHVFGAGLFTYGLLGAGYGLSRPAALVGAFTFAFSPKLISHLAGGHVGLVWGLAWAPAVLLGLELARQGWLLGAALSALALALQLPTHLQIPYYTATLASAYGAWRLGPLLWRALRTPPSDWQPVRRLVIVYGVWLAMFGLLAAITFFPLLELLPYNSRTNFTLADAGLYALPPFLLITLLVPSNFQFPEWTMFVGFLPLVLGALGGYSAQRQVWLFFALVFGFGVVYALGTSTPLFGLAQAVIPGFKMLRVPTRFWFFGGLAAAVLAGLGADLLGQEAIREHLSARWRWLALGASVYGAGALIAWIAYWVLFKRWHEPTLLRLVTAGLIFGIGSLWLRGAVHGRWVRWLLVPLLLLDILPVAAAQIDLANPHNLFLRPTPAFNYVSAQPGVFRVYSVAGDLPYSLAAERNVETLEGLLAFQIGHTGHVIRLATGCTHLNYATAIPPCLTDRVRTAVPDATRLGELNVRYVLSHEPLVDPNFEMTLASEPAVYENLRWQPRARILPDGTAEILDRAPGDYEISVAVPAPGRLVVSETWLPGWQATVDGRPRPVERVESALLGVAVRPGDQRIRISYQPLGWRLGWPITLLALLLLLAWCLWDLVRRSRRSVDRLMG